MWLERLRLVQNSLARVVTRSRPYARDSPLLQPLQWLSIKFGLDFKLTLLTFKTFKTGQPQHLCALLSRTIPSRTLRSNQGILLRVPRLKTVTRSRAFSFCALRVKLFSCYCGPRFQLPSSKRNWKHISLVFPILHRHLSSGSFVVDLKRQRTYGWWTWNG